MPSYKDQFAQALLAQQGQADPLQKKYEDEVMKKSEVASLAPTLGLVDHLTGSNFAAQVPKQESVQDKLAKLLTIRQQAQAQKLGGLGKLAALEQAEADKQAQRAFQEKMYGLQLLNAKAKLAKATNGGARKLGAEDIKAVNNVDTILSHLPKLQQALDQGHGLNLGLVSSFSGDNPATAARRNIVEAFGRLQSGGAMSKDEVDNFTALVSQTMDDPQTRKQKIEDLFNQMQQRRNAYINGPSLEYQGPTLSGGEAAPARAPGSTPKGLAGLNLDDLSDAEIAALYNMHIGG